MASLLRRAWIGGAKRDVRVGIVQTSMAFPSSPVNAPAANMGHAMKGDAMKGDAMKSEPPAQ
jgi:hypothetical protein